MKISGTTYGFKHKNYQIYVSGCNGYCKGCHNKELWSFDIGKDAHLYHGKISDKVNEFSEAIDSIWLLGGEPLDQDRKELIEFCQFLKSLGKPLYLFTSYPLNRVFKDLKNIFDYIKCGQYDESQLGDTEQYGITLKTLNQKIYKKGLDY